MTWRVSSLPDDNSNQSSIADSSPVKQENSCSTSPAPEPTALSHRENSETKTDQSPDSKRGQTLAPTQTPTVLNESSTLSALFWPSEQLAGGGDTVRLSRWMMSHILFLFPPRSYLCLVTSGQTTSHWDIIKTTASPSLNIHTENTWRCTDTVQLWSRRSPQDFNQQPSFRFFCLPLILTLQLFTHAPHYTSISCPNKPL